MKGTRDGSDSKNFNFKSVTSNAKTFTPVANLLCVPLDSRIQNTTHHTSDQKGQLKMFRRCAKNHKSWDKFKEFC